MSDRVLGGVGPTLAAFYFWAATIIPESFAQDVIGPSAFPTILAGLMAVFCLYFIVKPDPDPRWPAAGRLLEIAVATLVMFLYAQLLPALGFVIATALATAYLTWRLGGTVLSSLLNGVGTAVGLYVLFELIFGLSLADGPFGF